MHRNLDGRSLLTGPEVSQTCASHSLNKQFAFGLRTLLVTTQHIIIYLVVFSVNSKHTTPVD
jgi:hypothetical protein